METELPASWDCFDTLVARRRCSPHSIFWSMAYHTGRSGGENFVGDRCRAEQEAGHSLDTIYDRLKLNRKLTTEECDRLKQLEIETEIEHCIPINKNMLRVKDGDYVVSDMYLPAWVLRAMLRKCGLKANVNIVVGQNIKGSGHIWGSLPAFSVHTGDNGHADVNSPVAHGRIAELSTEHIMTELELAVGNELAMLMRAVRLANPYPLCSEQELAWREFSQITIPMMVSFAAALPAAGLCFTNRDCTHLQKIHERLHGTRNASYEGSRFALLNPTKAYVEHVRQNALGKILIDVQGWGNHPRWFIRKHFDKQIEMMYYHGQQGKGMKVFHGANSDAVEKVNAVSYGSLRKWPTRWQSEQSTAVGAVFEECSSFCANEIKFFPELSFKTKLCGSSWSEWNPQFLYFPASVFGKIHAAMHASPALGIITHHTCHWGHGPLSAVNRGVDYNFDPETYTPPEE